MKKKIFIQIVFLLLSLQTMGQLTVGIQSIVGNNSVKFPSTDDVRNISERFNTIRYKKKNWYIESQFVFLLLQDNVVDNQADHFAFSEYGLGLGFISNEFKELKGPPEHFFFSTLICPYYKNIIEDFYSDSYSLNLQNGGRIGLTIQFNLEIELVQSFINVNIGAISKDDLWIINSSTPSNQVKVKYDGLYFQFDIDLMDAYRYTKEHNVFRRK